jgi:hypothetical protein
VPEEENITGDSEFLNAFTKIDFNKMEEDNLIIVPTQQLKPKLCNDGYYYIIDKMNSNTINWKCDITGSRVQAKCPGRAQSTRFRPPLKITVEHNHEPDPLKEKTLIVIAKMLQKSLTCNDNPRTIFKDCILDITDGCWFHLCQNLWKHMVDKGFKTLYNRDLKITKAFKWLKCLAFVPISDITKAFLIIKIRSPDTFMPVLDYFEQYYIGNLKKGSRSVREIPMFPPSKSLVKSKPN